jgi:hypothetical protein
MARKGALAAIARAIDEHGDVDVAYRALARLDPLARGRARRLVRETYLDALGSTAHRGPENALHALRIAYLSLARTPVDPGLLDDPAAVAEAYAAARRARPYGFSKIWWRTISILVVLSLGLVASAFGLARALGPRRVPDASERSAPPPRGAFASGGRPPPNPIVKRALSDDVPSFFIALDRLSETRKEGGTAADLASAAQAVERAEAQVFTPDLKGALGPAAEQRLAELLQRARAAAAADPKLHEATGDAFMDATGAFDDELAAQGLGYFVDTDVLLEQSTGKRIVLFYGYAVENVGIFESGKSKVRALELRRIDRLNWSPTLIGFTRPNLREALVVLDQLDDELLTFLVPALGEGGVVPLFDEDTAERSPEVSRDLMRRVEVRAGELVREEVGAADRLDAATGKEMGRLLRRRRELIHGWRDRLKPRGVTLTAPKTLRIEGSFLAQLKSYVPPEEIEELERVDKELGGPAVANAFDRIRALLSASVERHEVQHRLDFARADPLPMPPRLEAMVGPVFHAGKERRAAVRARAELSAYVAELARDDRTTRVNLTLVTRFLFSRRMQGTAPSYAAIVILEGLGEELSIPVKGHLVVGGNIDRDAASELWLSLVSRPAVDLQRAAGRLWAKLFGSPLAELRKQR